MGEVRLKGDSSDGSADCKDTPVFIVSFNRLSYLRQVVDWFVSAGYTNVTIVDNASTYPPLQEYLKNAPCNVEVMKENFGHLVLWKSGRFDSVTATRPFVLTDCDVLPCEECPDDVVARLGEVLRQHPKVTKAGLALRIDDLPDCYAHKPMVLEWERKFWIERAGEGLFDATIDTTFALYRPGIKPENKNWWRSIRTDQPCWARHLPWYADTSSPTDEDLHYQNSALVMSSLWSITDPAILKKKAFELQLEVLRLKKDLELSRLGLWYFLYEKARNAVSLVSDWTKGKR